MTSADELLDLAESHGVTIWVEGERLRFRASEGALTDDLRQQLGNRRPEIMAAWRAQAAKRRQSRSMSWNQLGLWLVHNAQPDSAAYHVAVSARVVSALDVGALHLALQALVDRHEILRTVYMATDDEPLQVVLGSTAVDFECIDVAGGDDNDISARVRSDHERPFDLSARTMRARLYLRAADDAVLLIVWHHIAVDGWATWLLLDELRALYQAHVSGAMSGLRRPETQYSDFAEWQRELVNSAAGESLWEYWKQQLSGVEPLASFADRPRRLARRSGATVPCHLSSERVSRLKALATRERTSLFVVLLTSFKVLLHRYTGQTDIVIGAPTFGRSRPEVKDLVGDLVNTVPLRTNLSGATSFRELLSRVRDTTLGGLAHADYPFALLVRRLEIRREAGRSPLVDVLFNLQTPQRARDLMELFVPGSTASRVSLGGLMLAPFPMAQQEAQFDLSVDAVEHETGITATFTYRSDLFDRATIERLRADWTAIIDAAVANPDVRITDLVIASPDEARKILAWNETARPVPGPLTLHGPFELHAKETPDALAVADARGSLTYRELDRLASSIARHLRRHGAGVGTRVGIAVERSVAMVAAVIGVLKTGAAYVPLDPSYPVERLAHMVRDSDATLILTERPIGAHAHTDPAQRAELLYVEDCLHDADDGPLPYAAAASPNDAAYIMYTSGSTGGPKGVVVQHRAVAAMLDAFRERFSLSRADRWVALTTLSFDISVLELFGPLSCGGCAFIASRPDATDGHRLAGLVAEWQPNLLQATPATWRLLLDAGWNGDRALTILVGGEALSTDLASRLLARCGRLFNVYGPTETTIWSTAAHIVDADAPITIGTPLANVRTYVLDDDRRLLPVGVPGELWIGGEGVAAGYYGREALTNERFTIDPFSQTGGRMYRTGDRARWRPTGELECLGRLDHQVKIRGHRVELGEIENTLERHPAVRQAAVTTQPGPAGHQLAAYVVPSGEIAAGDLRRFLRDSLPDYMIPAFFRIVESLPLTANGKVDRRRLPASEADDRRAIAGPSTPLEATLVRLWEEMLDVHPVGVTDNFFDLGGHSLLATRLCAKIAEHTGRTLHVATLLQAPTVSELAARIQEGDTSDAPLVIPFRTGGSGIPYFCVPGGRDNPFIFADLARHLQADRPVYSFRFPDVTTEQAASPRRLIADLASRLILDLRAVQPAGPFLLGGYCFGGLVAFEMASQLARAGDRVASVSIFDMYLPGGYHMARLRDRVAHQVQYMKRLPWQERPAFVARMAGQRLVRVRRRWDWAGWGATNRLSATDYLPQYPVSAPLTLFRARDGMEGLVVDEHMGWRGLADDIVVHDIDGQHTDAYKEPYVSRWVDALRLTLIEAERRSEQDHPQQQAQLA